MRRFRRATARHSSRISNPSDKVEAAIKVGPVARVLRRGVSPYANRQKASRMLQERRRWSELSDDELTARVHLDDPSWLDEVFKRHSRRLRSCAHRMVAPPEVEDATQEIAERILKGLPRFRGDSSLSTWLYAVARNTCLDVRRRRKGGSVMGNDLLDTMPGGTSPESDFNLSVLGCRTALAVRDLTETQAQVVLLRLGEGLSTAETARRLGISEDAVKTRLTRARRRLRVLLGEAVTCRECGPGKISIDDLYSAER